MVKYQKNINMANKNMVKNSLVDEIKSAISDFKRNKVRTLLTSLGIMIGVLSVVLLIALGLGLKNYLKQQFDSLGANLIIVLPGNVFNDEGGIGGGFGPGFAGGAKFDEKDYQSLLRIPEVDYASPNFLKSSTIEANGIKKVGYVEGVGEQAFKLLNLELAAGETFTKADVSGRSKKGVLGYTMAEKLFGIPEQALGKTVKAGDMRIKVIGVAKKKGDQQVDTAIFIPYRTTFGTINPDKTFFNMTLGTTSEENVQIVKQKAKEVLLKRYKSDSFSVTEQSEILSTVNQIFGIVNGVLVAIGSISLIVGGIGIMNIMYATVTERIKEVGIRRAIGATKNDILKQFLVESVLLSLFGGLLGLIFAVLIVLGVRQFFPASINAFSVIITILISSGIGVFFGVFPAKRAANLPPIEAIRYE